MVVTQDFIDVNPYSRCGRRLAHVVALIFHWNEKPMMSAKQIRDYFDSLKVGLWDVNKKRCTYGSAQYDVGPEGEIVQIMPEDEEAFHVGSERLDLESGRIYTDWAREKFDGFATDFVHSSPNRVCIGVEMGNIDAAGRFSDATLYSAAELGADICLRRDLDPTRDDVGTHHMVVGWKDCPRLWTLEPGLFEEFKQEISIHLERLKGGY